MTDSLGRTPLHYAAAVNNELEVRRLLSEGADPDATDHNGETPLHFAAQEWAVEAARTLLDGGASVDPTDIRGNTPLFLAANISSGRGELIELLRERGADPFRANKSGLTPVTLARLSGSRAVRKFFKDL